MAEKLCELKKKGGGELKETTLWTNSSPTNSFSAQDVTLSQSIDNYKYISVHYKRINSGDIYSAVIYEKEEFKQLTGTDPLMFYGVLGYNSGGADCYRKFTYLTDTKIHFYNATRGGGANSGLLIPTKVCGLK